MQQASKYEVGFLGLDPVARVVVETFSLPVRAKHGRRFCRPTPHTSLSLWLAFLTMYDVVGRGVHRDQPPPLQSRSEQKNVI